MEVTSNKQNFKAGMTIVFLLFLNFLTFLLIRRLNFERYFFKDFFHIGLAVVLTGALTLGSVWLLCALTKNQEVNFQHILFSTLTLFWTLFMDEQGGEYAAFFFSDYEYLWELFMLGATAVYVGTIEKALDKNFTYENSLAALLCMLTWFIISFTISEYMTLEQIVYMVLTNSVVVWAAIFKLGAKRKRYGNCAVFSLLYTAYQFLIVNTAFPYGDGVLRTLFNDEGWHAYKEQIGMLFAETEPLGAACDGISKLSHELIYYSEDAIHAFAYYFGWSLVFFYLCVLIALMIRLGKVVYKVRNEKMLFILSAAAYGNLLIHSFFGSLYAFGIFPLQISLPFVDSYSYLTDYGCAAVLLAAAFKDVALPQWIQSRAECKRKYVDWLVEHFWLEDEEEEESKDEIDEGTY